MTVSSVKTGDLGISFALNNNYMEPIATTLVGSGGLNQVTFNDIPQTYKHLQVRVLGRSDRSATLSNGWLQFNGDNGSNYFWHTLFGDGATVTSAAVTSASNLNCLLFSGASSTASVFGLGVIDILDYTNTNKNTTIRSLTGIDNNGSGNIRLYSGAWNNFDAITSIKLVMDISNFVQYSRISLYGIKG